MNNAAKTTKKISNGKNYWGKLIKPGMSIEERREIMTKFLQANGIA